MLKFLAVIVLCASSQGWDSWYRRFDPRCPSWTTNPPVMLSDPEDCSRFFKCQGGFAFPVACPSGQHWDAKAYHCDWPK